MRSTWDEYFLEIARVVATRSTCKRKQVGCVLVRDKTILSTGYGGSIRGQPHCIDEDCIIGGDGGCQRTIHSEVNAVAQAARNGICTNHATVYITLSPCLNCFKMMTNAGIKRIVFSEAYRIPIDPELVQKCGITLNHMPLKD